MHMSSSLVTPAVGAAMFAVSGAAVVYSIAKIKAEGFDGKRAAQTLALGAFVFAAQAVNFAIPATGSSGHIGGGILLAALVGAFPAMLAMTAILTIQCLAFADGGLLALGANVFNLGVIPCLIVYPLAAKLLTKNNSAGKTAAVSMLAAIIGLELGALAVAVQTHISGVTALPFTSFAPTMLFIHLAIGIAEGAITAGIMYIVCKTVRSDTTIHPIAAYIPIKKFATIFTIATLITGGALVPFASSAPDGLEWSIEKIAGVDFL